MTAVEIPSATTESGHTKHDDIKIENVPPAVQITDPEHPLFGQTYPIVSLATPHGRNWLAIQMPCGSIRVISYEATNLNGQLLDLETWQQLPPISVPVLLHLQQLLQRQKRKKEHKDGKNSQETGGHVTRDPNTLAPIDPHATRTDRRRRATNSAPMAADTDTTPGGKQ
jgi:hypothetical protein